MVRNTFMNFNVYVSQMFIYEYPKCVIIKFNLWVYKSEHFKIVKHILDYLRSLLVLRYNKNVEFEVKFSRNIFSDELLLGTFIKKNSDKMRSLLKLFRKQC